MNKDQVYSLTRSALKLLSGVLIAHGMSKVGSFLNAEDCIAIVLAIVSLVWSHTTHSDDPTKPTPTTLLTLLTLCALCGLMAGCTKSTLAPGGAYASLTFTNSAGAVITTAPDLPFETVDSSFKQVTADLRFILKFEQDNEAVLWKLNPGIKHTLDKIRPVAWQVISDYTRARAVYIRNPTPANLSPLTSLLSKIQALAAAAAVINKP